jgi:hypothetical protein
VRPPAEKSAKRSKVGERRLKPVRERVDGPDIKDVGEDGPEGADEGAGFSAMNT